MSNYKTDQDRFFDSLRDLKDFRDAAEEERSAEAQALVDRGAKFALKHCLADTEAEGRDWIISVLKRLGKLPADYSYPEERSR
jgi:hypothetical protein